MSIRCHHFCWDWLSRICNVIRFHQQISEFQTIYSLGNVLVLVIQEKYKSRHTSTLRISHGYPATTHFYKPWIFQFWFRLSADAWRLFQELRVTTAGQSEIITSKYVIGMYSRNYRSTYLTQIFGLNFCTKRCGKFFRKRWYTLMISQANSSTS